MLNQKHADVLIASAENKRKKENQRLLYILLIFSVVVISALAVFFDSNGTHTSSDAAIEDISQIISEKDINQIDAELSISQSDTSVSDAHTEIIVELRQISESASYRERVSQVIERIEKLFKNIDSDSFIQDKYNKAIIDAKVLIGDYRKAVERSLTVLDNAFTKGDKTAFNTELDKLESLAANNKDLKNWMMQRAKVEKYFQYVAEAKIARAESKAENELLALQSIINLDYSDDYIQARIEKLEVKIAENNFTKSIRRARTLVIESKFLEAKIEISKAGKIFPSRQQVKVLMERIDYGIKSKNFDNLLAAAATFIKLDDWENARQKYAKALVIMSDNKSALDGYKLSDSIVKINEQLMGIIERPLRLGSNEVFVYAKNLMSDAELYLDFSNSLFNSYSQVKILTEQKMVPKEIWIESNSVARIEVRGVGFIEPTEGKFISLLPGEYDFYSTCIGHKTKIYEVVIPVANIMPTIKVLCGESL